MTYQRKTLLYSLIAILFLSFIVAQNLQALATWAGKLDASYNKLYFQMRVWYEGERAYEIPSLELNRAKLGEPEVIFAVIGDFGNDNEDEKAVAELVKSWQPDFIVTAGDNSYDNRTVDDNVGKYYSDYIGAYKGNYGIGSPTNRFFPATGNHDYHDGEGINAYLDYFTLPGTAIESSHSSGNERYYDHIQGPIHFFAIDSQAKDANGPKSPQAQWLKEQLAASTYPWQLVYFHHPPYTSGRHGNEKSMQWPFAEWGADLIITGHDHNYERLLLDGIVYFVNGTGGRHLRPCGKPIEGSQICYDSRHGAMRIEGNERYMLTEFYNVHGVLIDAWVFEK